MSIFLRPFSRPCLQLLRQRATIQRYSKNAPHTIPLGKHDESSSVTRNEQQDAQTDEVDSQDGSSKKKKKKEKPIRITITDEYPRPLPVIDKDPHYQALRGISGSWTWCGHHFYVLDRGAMGHLLAFKTGTTIVAGTEQPLYRLLHHFVTLGGTAVRGMEGVGAREVTAAGGVPIERLVATVRGYLRERKMDKLDDVVKYKNRNIPETIQATIRASPFADETIPGMFYGTELMRIVEMLPWMTWKEGGVMNALWRWRQIKDGSLPVLPIRIARQIERRVQKGKTVWSELRDVRAGKRARRQARKEGKKARKKARKEARKVKEARKQEKVLLMQEQRAQKAAREAEKESKKKPMTLDSDHVSTG